MARKLKKKLPKAQFGLIDDVAKIGQKYLPKIFPKPIPPSVLGPMKTFKVGKDPALTFDDWRSYIETGNVQPAFEPFFSQKAGQHIFPPFAPVDEFGTVGLTGDLVRKESNRFNNLVFDRGLMISPAQGTGRKSVHFTGTGKPVPGHLMGNWDHVTTTFTLPMADAIRYNAMPRSTAPNDVYFYSPRQFVYPPSTKILTGDMELASNARGIGLDVNFNKELFKLNKQLNKIEELKNTPGTKYSYNESTSSGNFNSEKYNLYQKDREPLVSQVKKLTDDWLTGLNLQGIDHLNPAYKLGFRDFVPSLRSDQLRNIRSSSETPYVHSESPEFNLYYMEGLKDASGNTVKSRSQRIDENPSLLDDITMDQAKDPAYNLFDNSRIYKGGYDKKGMVEPSQADLILYQKQIFSYPKEYVEKILANYDAKNFPKDGPYRKILENYIKDGSAGVKYNDGGSLPKKQLGGITRLGQKYLPRIFGNPTPLLPMGIRSTTFPPGSVHTSYPTDADGTTPFPTSNLAPMTFPGGRIPTGEYKPALTFENWQNRLKSFQPLDVNYNLPLINSGGLNSLINSKGLINTNSLSQFINKTKGVNPQGLYDRNKLKLAFNNLGLDNKKFTTLDEINTELKTNVLNVENPFGIKSVFEGKQEPLQTYWTNNAPELMSSDNTIVLKTFIDGSKFGQNNLLNFYKDVGHGHFQVGDGTATDGLLLGHSRLYFPPLEPGVTVEMETQSDLGQKLNKRRNFRLKKNNSTLEDDLKYNTDYAKNEEVLNHFDKYSDTNPLLSNSISDFFKNEAAQHFTGRPITNRLNQFANFIQFYDQPAVISPTGGISQPFRTNTSVDRVASTTNVANLNYGSQSRIFGSEYERELTTFLDNYINANPNSLLARADWSNLKDKYNVLSGNNVMASESNTWPELNSTQLITATKDPLVKEFFNVKLEFDKIKSSEELGQQVQNKYDAAEENIKLLGSKENPDLLDTAVSEFSKNSDAIQLNEIIDYSLKMGNNTIRLPLPKTVIDIQGYNASPREAPNPLYTEYKWTGHNLRDFEEDVLKAVNTLGDGRKIDGVNYFELGDGYSVRVGQYGTPYIETRMPVGGGDGGGGLAMADKDFMSNEYVVQFNTKTNEYKLVSARIKDSAVSVGEDGTYYTGQRDDMEFIEMENVDWNRLSKEDRETYNFRLADKLAFRRNQFLNSKGHDVYAPPTDETGLKEEHQTIVNKYKESERVKSLNKILGKDYPYKIVIDQKNGHPYLQFDVYDDTPRNPIKGKDIYKLGGSLLKAQDGTGLLNPQYQAIIYYNPDDPNDYFTADLERMTPELNQRYGVGNWIARPLPNFGFTDEYESILKEQRENPFFIKFKKEMEVLDAEINKFYDEINKERKANNYSENKSERQIELEKEVYPLTKQRDALQAKVTPMTYLSPVLVSGEYKFLDDAEFESEDHKNYIINIKKIEKLEEDKKDLLSSVDSTNKYFQDIKNLSPTGDIIIMQHGTGKVGPIMMSEAERESFQTDYPGMYKQTPGITDTFSEVINENFDDASGITCYMGMCKQTDSGQRLANTTGMTVNVASGPQWSGYQTGFGDTFIDRFFGTGKTLDSEFGKWTYGYDTYKPSILDNNEILGPYSTSEAFFNIGDDPTNYFRPPEYRQHGGALPKAQIGRFLPSLKSITNPLGRFNYKINPFPVTPKSQLLIPGRSYGDVQHKIPNLINQFQRTDTPMLANLIMPRANLETGELFATGMTDRIQTFLPEGQKLNEPFKLMDGNTRFWLGEQMGKNWDDEYRIIQSSNKSLFPEIDKFNLKLSKRPDGSLAWFKPDGTEYTDLVDAKQPFPSIIGRDKTSPLTLFQGPRLIKDRADLENQFNIRNTAYHTVNITDDLRNNEIIRSQAKKYGFNPDDDRELAMFLGTSPGGSGRRGGYSSPEGYDILFSGNNPRITLERYGNLQTTPFTVQFNLMDAMAPRLLNQKGKTFGPYPQLNAPGNKMPIGSHGLYASDLGLYDRISAFDTKNSNFPQFGIASPFSFDTELGMSTFKKGLDPDDYQGLIINPNSLHVPGLTQTNLIFGKENVPVRMPTTIYTPDEVFKMTKEYGGQTPGLALDDIPDRTYKDGGATRTSLSEYQNGGDPNYNQMLIKFIKDQEAGMEYMKAKNSSVMKPDGSGYYKRYEDGKFYPYYHQNADGSFESEATIGYGTKGLNIYDMYKEGMSVPEANIALNKAIENAHRKTKIYVDANYGDGFYDKLSDQKKVMLADFTFNLGRLSKFPSFAKGILTDDTDLALAEYIRGEQKGGAKLARNEAYLETFLQPWVDQTIERKAKEAEAEKLRLLNEERDNIMKEKYSSWYSPFVPNSIENLFKQNYDWEDQYWKDKGITTYQGGGTTGGSAFDRFGGMDEYSNMLNFLSYQEALKSGNKTMADFYADTYGYGDMSFDDMYSQARKIYDLAVENPDDGISQSLIRRMVDDKGVPQFEYKGKPYGTYSYTEVPSEKLRSFEWALKNRLTGIYNNPEKQNTNWARTINPTTGEYSYEPAPKYSSSGSLINTLGYSPSEDLFLKEGDLQKYIDEQFPEGSKERAFLDANPGIFDQIVSDYEEYRPHLVFQNQSTLFPHIYDPVAKKYIHNFDGKNKRYIELEKEQCNELKKKHGEFYNCQTGRVEVPGQAYFKQDNRTDEQRRRDNERYEQDKRKKDLANIYKYNTNFSLGLPNMAQNHAFYDRLANDPNISYGEMQNTLSSSGIGMINSAVYAGLIGRAGAPVVRGGLNLLKTPAARFAPRVFNPNAARPFTVGDALNVGFGTYGTATYGPSMISNIAQGEYGDAASDAANLALYNIGVPGSIGRLNRGLNFGKVYPGQFTKSILPQRNITPATLDAFRTKYPNLGSNISPQYYENFARFSQQLPNYSLINPIRTTFPSTQRFIGQPTLTQSGFGNVFRNLDQGATIVK